MPQRYSFLFGLANILHFSISFCVFSTQKRKCPLNGGVERTLSRGVEMLIIQQESQRVPQRFLLQEQPRQQQPLLQR